MSTTTKVADQSLTKSDWQSGFLALLPAIQRYAQRAFNSLEGDEFDEAVQAVVASAAVAYARLIERGKAELAYATPLAQFAVKQYRCGRLIGGSVNSHDVGSTRCRQRECQVEPIDQWKDSLYDDRHATPAELAALRVDFSDWYGGLPARSRQLVNAMAEGERTSRLATLYQVSAGRISQLRRELYESCLQFVGDGAQTAAQTQAL